MAESTDKAAESAEKAYAEAAQAKPVAPAPKVETAPVKSEAAPAAKTPAEQPVAADPAPKKAAPESKTSSSKTAQRKPAKRQAPAKKTPAKSAAKKVVKAAPAKNSRPKRATAPKAKPAAAASAKPLPTITQLKEKIMATAKTPDFTKPFADAMGDMQSKAKAAYEKSTAYAGEMTEFTKGNVEAMVESGKILSTGMQDMGKTLVEEAKSAYEMATADVKEMATVKSPTELFQLQGKLARRNFESMVSFSSKTGDAMMKLYTDAFAPISGRVSLAAEKISKVA